jgi:predicted amidohydrolase
MGVLRAKLQAIAAGNKTQLVGLTVFGDGCNDYNRALVLQPDGSTPMSYDVHHLIRGLEPYPSGDHLELMPRIDDGQWGVLICKDMGFPRCRGGTARAASAYCWCVRWTSTTTAGCTAG